MNQELPYVQTRDQIASICWIIEKAREFQKTIYFCFINYAKLTYMQSTIMRNTGLDEAQAGIKIARRNINNLKYIDDTTLMAESEEELKSLLMKMKEESEKVGLKAQHSEN